LPRHIVAAPVCLAERRADGFFQAFLKKHASLVHVAKHMAKQKISKIQAIGETKS
jgi:hypothetical protein